MDIQVTDDNRFIITSSLDHTIKVFSFVKQHLMTTIHHRSHSGILNKSRRFPKKYC